MNNAELTDHIKEYEKEYRWLEKHNFCYALMKYAEVVEIMRQYANDLQKESVSEYHLNCDYCGKLFWSKEAFPVRKMCTACYNNIVND
jgi:hypothetical protein